MTEQAKRKGRPQVRPLVKGERTYFTGKPCVHGHISDRYTASGLCIECTRVSSRDYRKSNSEECRQTIRNHYDKNTDAYKERAKEWAINNANKRSTIRQKYAQSERGKLIKYEGCARRRASKKKATPPWINKEDLVYMRQFYQEATLLTQQTGVQYHVDHIIPLNGNDVSGLHVPWNLQVLVWKENVKKSNRIDV